MERNLHISGGVPKEKPQGKACETPRPNGTKPAEIYRRPESQKKHITSDGRK